MEYPQSPISVLVVDDCATARSVLREVLAVVGCRVTEADTAEAGLDHLSTQTVDVLVCDLALPGKSGLWLAQEAVSRGFVRSVVAVSGGGVFDGVDWLDAARMAGIDRVLSKPVPLNSLIDAVLGSGRGQSPRTGARPG